MTKNDMVVEISKRTGLRQKDVKRVIQLTFEFIADALHANGRVELRNFGVFKVRVRKARQARNPRTGMRIDVPEKKIVNFKPSKRMETVIRGD